MYGRNAPSATRGFTLIEVLVALGLISLAALGITQLLRQSIVTTSGVRDRLIAGIVAENRIIESLARPVPQTLGDVQGTTSMAGQTWLWIETQAATSDPAIVRVEVVVRAGANGPELSRISALRSGT